MPTYINVFFNRHDVVRGGDFVLRLAEGLERPDDKGHHDRVSMEAELNA